MQEFTTTITERGQTSIPAAIRKAAKLSPGQVLRWELCSERELRIFITNPAVTRPSAIAMIGYARQFDTTLPTSTDEWMKMLREGESEDSNHDVGG